MHHVTLLQILLLAAGALAASPLPCLWGLSQALGGPTLDALGAPSCTWVSLGHLQARLESRLQLYKEEGNGLLKGLGRFCLDAAGTNPIPRLSIVQSSLHVWGGGTPQVMSFKHPVSFSGVPPAAPLSRSPSPGEARRTGVPGQPSPPLPAAATLLHPLPATRDVAKPSVGDPHTAGGGGRRGAEPGQRGRLPAAGSGPAASSGPGQARGAGSTCSRSDGSLLRPRSHQVASLFALAAGPRGPLRLSLASCSSAPFWVCLVFFYS